MNVYINLLYKFLICVILYEIKVFRNKLSYLNFFFSNINFLKYLFYLFDKDINPLKINEFSKYIKLNKKKWKKFEQNTIFDNNKETILVENFVNHPSYSIGNILIGKYLQLFYKSQCVGLLRKGDIKGEVLFRSLGIDKFYYYKFGGFYQRCKYIFEAAIISRNIKDLKNFFKVRKNNIDIGLCSYDSFIRYTRTPNSKKVNFKIILFIAESLYAQNFFSKILNNSNITKLVQAENNYIPLRILFQVALLKKKRIYTRIGNDRISVRIYKNFSQRYQTKHVISKKLYNEIYKNCKTKSIKLLDKYYRKQIKNKFYGQTFGPLVGDKKNIIALWKASSDSSWKTRTRRELPKNFYQSLKIISKSELCKIYNWDKDKKIVTIFLPFLIDGNYLYGKQKLFIDNYTWVERTLDIIKKLKNVNWIIKEHPMERRISSSIDLPSMLKDLENKYRHIRLFSENFDPSSLIKFTSVVITHHSTAGIEYSSFGIPCVVAENAFYTNWEFPIKPKNVFEYKNLLKRVHKIGKLNKQKIEESKVLLFICNILLYNMNSFIPAYIPKFEARMKNKIDENKYWYLANKKLRKFNLNNDHFKKMFEKQLHYNNRHTINFDLCFLKNKILLDD